MHPSIRSQPNGCSRPSSLSPTPSAHFDLLPAFGDNELKNFGIPDVAQGYTFTRSYCAQASSPGTQEMICPDRPCRSMSSYTKDGLRDPHTPTRSPNPSHSPSWRRLISYLWNKAVSAETLNYLRQSWPPAPKGSSTTRQRPHPNAVLTLGRFAQSQLAFDTLTRPCPADSQLLFRQFRHHLVFGSSNCLPIGLSLCSRLFMHKSRSTLNPCLVSTPSTIAV